MIKEILRKDFINLLLSKPFNGCTYISIDSETTQNLTGGKKNPMKGLVTKKSIGNSVGVFQNKNKNGYEEMVKRRLKKENKDPESFELSPRSWGSRIPETCVVEHKGEYYMEVIFNKGGKSTYYFNGKEINKSEIIGFPIPKTSSGQANLENQVIIRTFKISSLITVKMNGVTYNLI